jgi:hypothetical protein
MSIRMHPPEVPAWMRRSWRLECTLREQPQRKFKMRSIENLVRNLRFFEIPIQKPCFRKSGLRLINYIGISKIYWNHSAFCGHCLGKPHGMMEYWNTGIVE